MKESSIIYLYLQVAGLMGVSRCILFIRLHSHFIDDFMATLTCLPSHSPLPFIRISAIFPAFFRIARPASLAFPFCFRWLPSSIFLISVLCRSAPLENYYPSHVVCPYIIMPYPRWVGLGWVVLTDVLWYGIHYGMVILYPSRPLSRSLTHSPQIQFVAKHFSSFLCSELNGHENITVATDDPRWKELNKQKSSYISTLVTFFF